ncbi:structural maintenance of chromosomes 2 [Actinidia rufa]|uniref:Structural maintenance of chromosomes 2 n=1 Tax=Actinidia rufa TaxID=165716 RepID=A0A7J0F0V6_9ERIC|nr:structural maintenance of chromosomes 2 [Actinidia rufa]
MYNKEICLEGFKSYTTRTMALGFDPYFNAITGLNILDSICFVLGITNLQQVRASNLQELVYKQGQAGITKATVSIVFDNSDRNRSPLGYEDCPEIKVTRKIVVGGRNKYLINGHIAQPSRVQNFFHSVQLNVNSPHFLIMHGRITKVLNMKPPEILSMLEEAAGTRMYESKKEEEKVRDNALHDVEEIKAKISEFNDNAAARMHIEIHEMKTNISRLTAEKEASMGGEGVLAGTSSGNEGKCLDDQLGDAKGDVGKAKTESKQAKTKNNPFGEGVERENTSVIIKA